MTCTSSPRSNRCACQFLDFNVPKFDVAGSALQSDSAGIAHDLHSILRVRVLVKPHVLHSLSVERQSKPQAAKLDFHEVPLAGLS